MRTTVLLFAISVLTIPAGNSQAEPFQLRGYSLTVPDGFTVEIAAEPPLVNYPIFADFDSKGRLYVAEASGVENWQEAQADDNRENWHPVLRLEDSDGDGKFDRRTVFARFPRPPQGSQWLDGSLYVASPPVIWKLTDADDDGVAEHREKWLEQSPDNITACLNDLHGPVLGPDGWLYWTKGSGAAHHFDFQGRKEETTARHIFRRHPGGGEIEQVMVGGMDNPVEVAFSESGDVFLSATNFQILGEPRKDGVIHSLRGGVYPKNILPVYEFPWTGPDFLPELSGWGALSPAGLMCYRSEAFGEEYRGNLFTALFNGHQVRRHVLTPDGATYRSDEEPFLRCDDVQFHPTDVLEDADGSLVVIETGGWYRHCCPSSTFYRPDVRGAIYRIRREGIPAPEDPRGLEIEWDSLGTTKLARLLDDDRVAVRDRAAEALTRAEGGTQALGEVLEKSDSEIARNLAVWALARTPGRTARQLTVQALEDPSKKVRHAALSGISLWRDRDALPGLLQFLREGELSERELRGAAEAMGRIGDEAAVGPLLDCLEQPVGRALEHALIFAIIEIGAPEETRQGLNRKNAAAKRAAMIALDQMPDEEVDSELVLAELDSTDDRMNEVAWWILYHRGSGREELLVDVFRRGIRNADLTESQRERLMNQIVKRARTPAIEDWLAQEVKDSVPGIRATLLEVMANAGGRRAETQWVETILDLLESGVGDPAILVSTLAEFPPLRSDADSVRMRLRAALTQISQNASLSDAVRLQALNALNESVGKLTDSAFELLGKNITPDQSLDRRSMAASILAKADLSLKQRIVLAGLIEKLALSELNLLLPVFEGQSDPGLGESLVDSLIASSTAANLNGFRLENCLAGFPDAIRTRAAPLYQKVDAAQRSQLQRAARILKQLETADPNRGLQVFRSQKSACSACHQAAHVGGTLGPHLRGVGARRTERDLLESILFPSASIVQGFDLLSVTTVQGEVFSGILRKDTPDELVLSQAPGQTVRIARNQVQSIQSSPVSIMPAGLDQLLSDQELADLVAYLKSLDS